MTQNRTYQIKKILLTVLLILAGITGYAQQIKMESFYLAATDLTAISGPTVVYDLNNEKCALIKVETTQTGFNFEVGMLGVTKTEQHPGEIWLYVPHGVKQITISHPQLGILRNQDLGMSVKQGRTYILKLTTDKVISSAYDESKKRSVEFTLVPPHAQFIINGLQESPNKQGILEKNLSLGSYSVKVYAQGYHTLDTIINIRDSRTSSHQVLRLKQAFGYLSIPSDKVLDGAEVYLDGELIGTAPINNEPVMSGNHEVKIFRRLYKPYQGSFVMTDSSTHVLRPSLEENFAQVTIKVPLEEAEIWVDNEMLGKGEWHGRLDIDRHTIQCRLASHLTTTKQIKIVSRESLTIQCLPPTPVYGGLHLISQPADCNVSIDGHSVGRTPFLLSNVLVGKKTIRVSKTGYQTQEFQIDITQDVTAEKQVTLNNICHININSVPHHSNLFIDGEYIGLTPQDISYPTGTYRVQLTKKGYKMFDDNILFKPGEESVVYRLKKKYLTSNQFYGDIGYQAISTPGLSVHLGGYISNFNVELGFIAKLDPYEIAYSLSDNNTSLNAKFEPLAITVKLGYGFIMGTKFQLTPQIGFNWIMLLDEIDTNTYLYDVPSALNCALSLRCHLALGQHWGLEITPEYVFPVTKSTDFDTVYNASTDMKNKFTGFSLGTGIVFYFSVN